MTAISRRLGIAATILAFLVLGGQAGLVAQNLGGNPVFGEALKGQTAAQPEGTLLNLVNWIGNVIAPVGAAGAVAAAVASIAMGRGWGKWAFTAIGLLSVSGITRILEAWITNGTHGVTGGPGII